MVLEEHMTEKIRTPIKTRNKQRFFAICGIVAPILFTLLVIVESLLRPGYSQIYNNVSDLGLGHNGILQIINFIIFGLLSIGFAIGLGSNLPARAGKATKCLVVVFGLGMMFAGLSYLFIGVFPEDYVVGIHTLTSVIAFLTIIPAQLLTWQALRGSDSAIWGRYRIYSLLSGLLTIFTLVAFSYTQFAPYHGATERLFIAMWMFWMELTGLKLYSLTNKQIGKHDD
jgi:hypothetical membrane protein